MVFHVDFEHTILWTLFNHIQGFLHQQKAGVSNEGYYQIAVIVIVNIGILK